LELARKSGDRYILARALNDHFALLYIQDRIDEAKPYMNEVEEIKRQITASGIRCFIFDSIQLQIGQIEWAAGNYQRARDLVMESQAHFQLIGEKQTNSWCLATSGYFSLEEKDVDQAREYFEAAIRTARECNDQYSVAVFKLLLCTPLYLQGKIEQARQALRDSLPVFKDKTPALQSNTLLKLLICPYFQVPARSIPILAVITRVQKELNIYTDPVIKHYYRKAEERARAALGDAIFETAFAENQKLSMDDVFDLALQSVEEM